VCEEGRVCDSNMLASHHSRFRPALQQPVRCTTDFSTSAHVERCFSTKNTVSSHILPSVTAWLSQCGYSMLFTHAAQPDQLDAALHGVAG
jgi:hypothetical protein